MNNKRKRISALLLCVLVATSVALAACQQEPEPTEPCTAHTDANKDGKCDRCGTRTGIVETTAPKVEKQEVEVNVSLHNQYGDPMANAVLIFISSESGKSVDVPVGADGSCKVTLPEGEYTISVDHLPENHTCGDTPLTVAPNMEHIRLEAQDNTPNGTEERPFIINSELTEVEFNAKETFTFQVRLGVGRAVIIENAMAELEYNEVIYIPDENGIIELRVDPDDSGATGDTRGQISFTVTNTADEGQTIALNLVADPGMIENPYELELGKTTIAQVKKEQTVYYSWTATADGTVTVFSDTAINSIVLSNNTTSKVSDMSEGKPSVSLEDVKKGDVILVAVSVIKSSDAEYDEVVFKLTME